MNYQKILEEGITIKSSGSSGQPKEFFQPPKKIRAANKVARNVQGITGNSRIYTIMKMEHAGGLFAQSLPGYEVGAVLHVEKFSPLVFIKKIRNYTHTHLIPYYAKILMSIEEFKDLDLTGITITCGADPITWDIIEAFVSKNCTFIVNWGMSEVGPITINHKFESMDEVARIKELCPENATILGSKKYCDYKVENEELVIKGDLCIFDDWYYTKDRVVELNDILFYTGRTNLDVDFNDPKKGRI